MKRPLGVVTVALGLLSVGLLLVTALIGIGAVAIHEHPSAAVPPILSIFLLLTALIPLLGLIWMVATAIGIWRLRPWGRISILILGGLLIAFGAISFFSLLVFFFLGPHLAPQQVAAKHIADIILVVIALCYAAQAAIGVWWLLYFLRPEIRALFEPPRLFDPVTGFYLPAKPPSRRPAAITILAVLDFVAIAICLLMACLPIPSFLFGRIVEGPAAHITYAVIGILAGGLGVGLLRLKPWARIGSIAFYGIGILNVLASLLPGSQQQLHDYSEKLIAMMHLPTLPNQPTPMTSFSYGQMMVSSLSGIAINGFLIWLMHYYRAAFIPAAAPPPSPTLPESNS